MTSAFGRGRAGRSAFPSPLQAECGPWVGCQDLVEPTAAKRNLLTGAQNMYPRSAQLGGGYVSRPGFERADSTQQLGTLGVRRTQLLTEFVKIDGTRYRVTIAGGKFYTYDWTTGLFTVHSLGALTLSTTARVSSISFADYLILSDGVNKPIAWDGVAFTELTSCPVIYGPLWVYYGKLFGIKAAERSTIVWSEENDPFLGYEAGGYNNAWTLGQTDQDPLTAGIGFNEAMVVFRARSMTLILGAVNDDFQGSGTRDGVSETVGTSSPWSVLAVGRTVLFVDSDGRPQRYAVNGSIDADPAMWEPAQTTIANTDLTLLDVVQAGYHPTCDIALFAVAQDGYSDPNFLLTFDGTTGRYVGIWTGFPLTAFGFWTDLDNQVRMMHGDVDGIPYAHGRIGGTVYNDGLAAGDAPIAHFLETGPLLYDIAVEKQFDRVDISVLAGTALTAVGIALATSTGAGVAQTLAFAASVAQWDSAIWDVAIWSGEASEQHGNVGTANIGRWCRVQISHEVLDETFGVIKVALLAFALGNYPRAP